MAYVLAEDLELYGTAFRKPLERFDERKHHRFPPGNRGVVRSSAFFILV